MKKLTVYNLNRYTYMLYNTIPKNLYYEFNKIINLDDNNSQYFDRTIFPDGQHHIKIKNIISQFVNVECSITDNNKLMELLLLSDALDRQKIRKDVLVIKYLMGARYDRVMQEGDSLDLQVIANLINSCNFSHVILCDAHSDASTLLINNSINISNVGLVKMYGKENSTLIVPDAGASKKVDSILKENPCLTNVVQCVKKRDLSNGYITLKVLEPELCEGKDCVIVDDLCDGGRTFIEIAKQIKPKSLTLIVTHGIFSKGFTELKQYFDEIITSDSYKSKYTSDILKVLPIIDVITEF